MTFKALALIVLTVIWAYRTTLSVLKYRASGNPVPQNVSDVYDAQTYRRWRAYRAEKTRIELISSTASYLIELALLAFNLYAAFARLFPKTDFWQMLAVILLSILSSQLLIPFAWYDTMVIEEKYGFNRSDRKTFWGDQLKGFTIELLLTLVIASLLMGTHKWLGDWLIVAFAGFLTLLMLAISFLYPVLSRVFNRFTPLEDGELKQSLTALLEKNGYKVRDIKVMDASRRTTKSNAYFSGFGRMKTIVLYDTLVAAMTPREILAVFAHEMGHGLHKDTLKNQILTFVQMMLLAVAAWWVLRTPGAFTSFGFEGLNYGFAVVLIMSVLFALIAPLFGLLVNALSRRAEYRADAQAVKEGFGPELIAALKKLARENFADLAPSPLVVLLEDSHPTLSQRIDAIEKGGR